MDNRKRYKSIDSEALRSFRGFLDDKPAPPYFNLLLLEGKLSKISIFIRSLLIGPIIFLLFYCLTLLLTGGNVPKPALLYMVLLSGIISSILVLTSNCYQKSVETMEHVLEILTEEDQLENLRGDFNNVFLKPTQLWFSFVFSAVVTSLLIPIGLTFPPIVSFILYVFMALGLFVAGFIVWMSFSALLWSIKLGRGGPYRLNNFPSKTLGIRKLSRLIGTYSLSFSLALSFVLIFFYIAPWDNQYIFKLVESVIVFPFIAFALVFIFVPQMSIRKIIVQEKERLLIDLERKLSEADIIKSEFTDEEYEKYININDLHSKIFATSDYALDIGTIGKFFSSLAFPVLFTIAQEPEIFKGLLSLLSGNGDPL